MSGKKDSVEAVHEYLRTQNRPYSVNDIVQNLHKEHGKTAVQKALDKLVQEEKVREKVYGKQKVYLISQANIPEATPEELKEMDKQIEGKERRVKELEAEIKEAQNELKALTSEMSTEEAQSLLDQLTQENAVLEEKHAAFVSGNVKILEKGERGAIRESRSYMLGEWRHRKKLCMGMVNATLEGWPGSKAELFEQSGIETDEDAEAIMPTD